MKPRRKAPALLAALALAITGVAFTPSAAIATTAGPDARASAAADTQKVVRVRSTDSKIIIDDARLRPGVTEFRVTKTASRRSSLAILETDNFDRALKKIEEAFGGGAGSADAMKAFDRIATLYGGGSEGARWQVRLSQGSYFIIDTNTSNTATFTVKGERRDRKLEHADSSVWATKDNLFKTDGPLSGNWVSFENNSREVHFMEADRVAKDTTAKDVRQGMQSPDTPEWIRPGGFFFEVQSPGIKTVYHQEIDSGRYLLICFMPSEEQDGVPHAMMGMWHLVNAA